MFWITRKSIAFFSSPSQWRDIFTAIRKRKVERLPNCRFSYWFCRVSPIFGFVVFSGGAGAGTLPGFTWFQFETGLEFRPFSMTNPPPPPTQNRRDVIGEWSAVRGGFSNFRSRIANRRRRLRVEFPPTLTPTPPPPTELPEVDRPGAITVRFVCLFLDVVVVGCPITPPPPPPPPTPTPPPPP